MPEILKCPKCDANADVTKDGKEQQRLPSAHSHVLIDHIQVNGHIALHVSLHPAGLGNETVRRVVIQELICSIGNNIFQPSESPDMKEGEKEEAK